MARQVDDDTLQRYYDGDLSPLEASSVRAEVEKSEALQKRLKELAKLSEMMKLAAAEMGSGLDADAMFAGISEGIKKDQAVSGGERLEVITNEWMEHKKGVLIPLIGAAAVAAAALIMVMRPATPAGDEVATQVVKTKRSESRPAYAANEKSEGAQPDVHGTRVENVDFGTSTGTVFEVDNQGVATAVVWISDEEELP